MILKMSQIILFWTRASSHTVKIVQCLRKFEEKSSSAIVCREHRTYNNDIMKPWPVPSEIKRVPTTLINLDDSETFFNTPFRIRAITIVTPAKAVIR